MYIYKYKNNFYPHMHTQVNLTEQYKFMNE